MTGGAASVAEEHGMSEADRGRGWHETQYSPSLTVPNAAEVLADWPRRAARTRATRPFLADLRTGDHPREVLDLFRAPGPRGTVVFIHGGYWQEFSKVETSWVAEGFLDDGYSVALLNYPLCPEVTLEALTASVRRSYAKLYADVLNTAERAAVVITGHSAGGHLAAAMVATDWVSFGLPERPFDGAAPISGLFDLAPLVETSVNAAVRLTPDSAARLSPVAARPRMAVPMTMVVGEAESVEFHRQSDVLARAWDELHPNVVEIPGADHFTVIDGLAEPGSILHGIVTRMLSCATAPPSRLRS